MRHTNRFVILGAALLALALTSCSNTLYTVTIAHDNSDGFVYSLPRTEVTLRVEAQRSVKTYGRYYCYAHLFGLPNDPAQCRPTNCADSAPTPMNPANTAGMNATPMRRSGMRASRMNTSRMRQAQMTTMQREDLPLVAATSHRSTCTRRRKNEWSIRSAAIVATAVPDARQRFAVNLESQGSAIDRTLTLTTEDDGRLSGAEGSLTNRRAEVAVAGIGAGLSLVGQAVSLGVGGAPAAAVAEAVAAGGDNSEPRVDPTRTLVRRCTASIRRALGPGAPADGNAMCRAALRLRRLIAQRDVVAGERGTEPDVAATSLERSIAVLDREIAAALAVFGEKTTKTSVTLLHPVSMTGTLDLCVQLNATSGALEAITCPATANERLLRLRSADAIPTETECTGRSHGIVYRVPSQVELRLEHGGRLRTIEHVTFPQAGLCAHAPYQFRGRDTQVQMTVSARTGMLTKLSVSQEGGATEELFEALGSSADGLFEAIDERLQERRERDEEAQEEAEAASDERAQLQRELDLALLRRQLTCLEQTGNPCPDESDDEEEESE